MVGEREREEDRSKGQGNSERFKIEKEIKIGWATVGDPKGGKGNFDQKGPARGKRARAGR